MFIVVVKHLIPKGFDGFSLFPFIFLKKKDYRNDKVFVNHERIHLQQQVELLLLPFLILYFTEYVFRLIQYRNYMKAYYNISFEREAYANENHLDYLNKRKFWAFLKYL